jgi:hypothetical protein
MSEQDGTGAGLLEFLAWAASRGEITPSTAKSIAVATRKVLATEPDPDSVDIRNLDPADLFDRFETLNRTGYTSDSIAVYRSRFFNAVAMYLAWLDKRSDWKTAGGWGRRSTGKTSGRASRDGVKTTASNGRSKRPVATLPSPQTPDDVGPSPSASPPPSTSSMIPYDMPLRPGLRVRLILPEMLTQADAKRIAAFVNSLAFDQAEAPPEGG